MKAFLVAAIAVLALIQLSAEPAEAITCTQVAGYLEFCVPYLTQGGDQPSDKCCDGLRGLVAAAVTTPDKRAACGCVKDAAARFPTIKDDAAQALPDKCKVKLDIPISRTVNCNAIN